MFCHCKFRSISYTIPIGVEAYCQTESSRWSSRPACTAVPASSLDNNICGLDTLGNFDGTGVSPTRRCLSRLDFQWMGGIEFSGIELLSLWRAIIRDPQLFLLSLVHISPAKVVLRFCRPNSGWSASLYPEHKRSSSGQYERARDGKVKESPVHHSDLLFSLACYLGQPLMESTASLVSPSKHGCSCYFNEYVKSYN